MTQERCKSRPRNAESCAGWEGRALAPCPRPPLRCGTFSVTAVRRGLRPAALRHENRGKHRKSSSPGPAAAPYLEEGARRGHGLPEPPRVTALPRCHKITGRMEESPTGSIPSSITGNCAPTERWDGAGNFHSKAALITTNSVLGTGPGDVCLALGTTLAPARLPAAPPTPSVPRQSDASSGR